MGPLKLGTGGICTRNSGDLGFEGLLGPLGCVSIDESACTGDLRVVGELVGAFAMITSAANAGTGDVLCAVMTDSLDGVGEPITG